jgi:hypothetical protein
VLFSEPVKWHYRELRCTYSRTKGDLRRW